MQQILGSALSRTFQQGQAAIILLLLVGLGVIALVYGLATPAKESIERDKKTAAALAEAREALIGRAASDNSIPGSLPCPDFDDGTVNPINVANDGIADLLAGPACPSNIGRLPWKTLGLRDLRDGSGERLWYTLSPNFRDDPSVQPLNSDTAGQLTITGSAPATNVVAIVFSPGEVLGTQLRNAANENNVSNYLETGNADGDTSYVSGPASDTFNDRLLAITKDALFAVVEKRVLRDLRTALRTYRSTNLYFPSANPYGASYNCDYTTTQGRVPLSIGLGCLAFADWGPELPSWFGANSWQDVTYYAVSPCRVGAVGGIIGTLLSSLCGTLGDITVDGNPSVHAVVFTAGSGISSLGQNRPCASVSDCLDDAQNRDGNDTFVTPMPSSTSNDRILIVWP